MAVNLHMPKQTNWWVWGGTALAVIVLIATLGQVSDWFGMSATDTAAPGVEQTTPATQ